VNGSRKIFTFFQETTKKEGKKIEKCARNLKVFEEDFIQGEF